MRFSCAQSSLTRGLSIVSHAVAPKGPMPVLGNILLEAEGGSLKLAATNLEISITCRAACDVVEPGSVTVPAKLLTEFVGSLPGGTVSAELNASKQTLHLQSLRYQANIKGIDASDFPTIPHIESGPQMMMPAGTLRDAIQQVGFAAATDDTRPVLAGVLMSFQPHTLTLAAADGFRLAVKKCEIEEGPQESLSILVPARSLNEVARIIGDSDEPVSMAVTDNKSQVMFSCGDVELVSRLIDGTFPNYQQIIPKSYQTRAVLSTGEFLNATKVASFFARDSNNIVKIELKPGGGDLEPGNVRVTAAAAEVGDNVTELDAVIDGQDCQIAFNCHYLSDVLGVITAPQVALEAISASSPGTVKAVGEDTYIHVIMPMHLGSR